MSINDRINYAKMKARHKKVLLPWYKKWWGVLIMIVIVFIFILTVFSTIYVFNKVKEIQSEKSTKNLEAISQEYISHINGDGSNYWLGLPKSKDEPKVTIVEFGNFSCHYSSLSAPAIRNVMKDFSDNVRYIYRDYPSQDSIIISLGARCAGEQGKFWEMHDMLYELQDDMSTLLQDNERKEFLIQMAEILEIDTDEFSLCLDDKRYLDKVKKDYEDGESLQIKGTPTWFINNYEITGSLSENNFREILSGILKE